MLKNYLKITLRSLLNNKLFSLINVFGLAVGITCAVFIGLYVRDELGYDRYHADYERVFRISRDFYETEMSAETLLAANAPQAAATLAADFPQIETTVRLFGGRSALLSHDETSYYEDSLLFADPTLFDIFSFDWIAGDPDTALDSPLSIVLTESTARKYFGDEDPLGQTLLIEKAVPLQVTGLIRDLPHNTHLKASSFSPMKAIEPLLGEPFMRNWNNTAFHTYVKLKPGADIEDIVTQLPAFLERHVQEGASEWSGMTAMNVADIHLGSNKQFELKPSGNPGTVYTFAAVAFSILVIACFNFMNLSTARSTLRMKEVGVRKYIGARKEQLVGQFLSESVVLAVLATVIALALVELLLPAFDQFIGKPLVFDLMGDPSLQGAMLGLVLFVGVFAGSYPAFYLSSFNPANVLRGTLGPGTADALVLRNCLVILQFSASIALLVATAVVLLQMQFARNIELGFRKDQIVTLTGSPTRGLGPQWDAMRKELLRSPGITSVTGSSILPFEENLTSYAAVKESSPENHYMPGMLVDVDFFATYDINVLAGRPFTQDFPADRWVPPRDGEPASGNVIINASAASELGWSPDEAVGKTLVVSSSGARMSSGRIVGVVSDSYFESVHFSVKPMLFILAPSTTWGAFPTLYNASIRITGNDVQATLDAIDRVWKSFEPDFPVVRRFLDEDFTAVYLDEDRQGEMLVYFTTLAILIACLGLFGLASFNTQRRMKEIGIRKVMGGSVLQIVLLITNDFSKLVLLANVIAWPVAWFAMNRWLANFAYRIDLTPMIFIGSGLIALCIAWVTVGGTAAKAANQKPVLALRYE